jgi:hypothetical protein
MQALELIKIAKILGYINQIIKLPATFKQFLQSGVHSWYINLGLIGSDRLL